MSATRLDSASGEVPAALQASRLVRETHPPTKLEMSRPAKSRPDCPAEPAGSAAAGAFANTPKSPIAFPLKAGIARPQSALAPLPCQSAQALRERSPPAPPFTQSGGRLGCLARTETPVVIVSSRQELGRRCTPPGSSRKAHQVGGNSAKSSPCWHSQVVLHGGCVPVQDLGFREALCLRPLRERSSVK